MFEFCWVTMFELCCVLMFEFSWVSTFEFCCFYVWFLLLVSLCSFVCVLFFKICCSYEYICVCLVSSNLMVFCLASSFLNVLVDPNSCFPRAHVLLLNCDFSAVLLSTFCFFLFFLMFSVQCSCSNAPLYVVCCSSDYMIYSSAVNLPLFHLRAHQFSFVSLTMFRCSFCLCSIVPVFMFFSYCLIYEYCMC